jgi:hypothetical protein
MGTVTTEQAKLVLNTFSMVLQNNLVTADAVAWNEYDGEMDDRNGLQVIEQVTPRYNVTRTVNGVKDLSAGTDGTVFGSEMFEITGTFNANMGWGDFVKVKSIGDARESKALLGAATSADWVGDGVTSINEWSFAALGRARLKENGVDDSELSYIFNHTDEVKLGDQIVKLPNEIAGSTTYREGFSGKLNGTRTMFTNQLPVLTVGTRAATGAGVVAGAAQNKDYATVAKAGASNGLRLTQNLAVSTFAAGATVKQGEVFTIPGVFAYDNRKQSPVTPARLQQFTVVADAVMDGAGAGTLVIFPAMVVPGSGAGDNININTAHATVTAAPANLAVLTFMGAANATLSPRLLLQKQSINVNTVPLIMPASGTAMRRRLSKVPISVRMWQHSDFYTGAHGVRFDVALNANIRDRLRISRVNGS